MPSKYSIRRRPGADFSFQRLNFSNGCEIATVCESTKGSSDFEFWRNGLDRSDHIGPGKFKRKLLTVLISRTDLGRFALLAQHGIQLHRPNGGDSTFTRIVVE
jgi:hypothetical protein